MRSAILLTPCMDGQDSSNRWKTCANCEAIRDGLLRYLGHRVQAASWRPRFEAASRRYLQNKSDVYLYGVLIRDVPPNANDLRVRVHALGMDRPNETRIELLAIYLPEGCINGIGIAAVAKRRRTGE